MEFRFLSCHSPARVKFHAAIGFSVNYREIITDVVQKIPQKEFEQKSDDNELWKFLKLRFYIVKMEISEGARKKN